MVLVPRAELDALRAENRRLRREAGDREGVVHVDQHFVFALAVPDLAAGVAGLIRIARMAPLDQAGHGGAAYRRADHMYLPPVTMAYTQKAPMMSTTPAMIQMSTQRIIRWPLAAMLRPFAGGAQPDAGVSCCSVWHQHCQT
jgi:hypothetical protein